MERYRAANDEYERVVAIATKAADGAYDKLDGPTMAYLAEAFYVHSLEADEQRRWATGEEREERWVTKTRETLDIVLPVYREFQAVGDLEGLVDFWTEEATYLAEAEGYRFDPESEAFAQLCRALNEAAIRAGNARLQRLAGAILPTPEPPPRAVEKREAAGAVQAPRTFALLAEEELERPSFDAGHSTKEATRTALRLLRELLGQLRAEEITRAHVSQFIDALTRCPVVRGKERELSLPTLVERYAERDVARLSLKTRQTHIGALQAIWNKLQRAGQIDEGRANPFANHKLGKATPSRQKKDFTRDEVQAMFSLPVFTNGERPTRGKGEASFWLPILLAVTGARPEEIAQLLITDLTQEAEDVWTLTITDDGVHPHKGPRRLKNGNSHRTFPLPQVLLDLGLLDYVEWLRADGEVALFPLLRTKGKRKLLYSGFGEWWLAYLRKHDAFPDNRRGGRDFRGTWATIAREAHLGRDAQEYIMGHSQGRSMNARYGDLRPLGDHMRTLSFDGWGLEKVRRWRPPAE